MFSRNFRAAALAVAALAVAAPGRAQTATIYGALSNFDVANNTGHHGHGFEVEIEGIQVEDITYTFSTQRYGAPKVHSTPTSVVVRAELARTASMPSFPMSTCAPDNSLIAASGSTSCRRRSTANGTPFWPARSSSICPRPM